MLDSKQKTAAIATTMLLSLPAVLPVGACGTQMAEALGWSAAYGPIETTYQAKEREAREKQALLVVAGSSVGVIGAGIAVGVGIRHRRNKKKADTNSIESGNTVFMENTTVNSEKFEDDDFL